MAFSLAPQRVSAPVMNLGLAIFVSMAMARFEVVDAAVCTACPTTKPGWCSPSGIHGGVYDRKLNGIANPHMLYEYHANKDGLGYKGVKNPQTCSKLCSNWTTSAQYLGGLTYNAALNANEACLFWTYGMTETGCQLYSNVVCDPNDPGAFIRSGLGVKKITYSGGSLTMGACVTATVSGDPHFSGADKSHFDFTGEPNKTYCLVSDSHIHINTFMGGRFGRWGDNPHKALTWIYQVGILWNGHAITVAAREGASWQYENGYLGSLTVDGQAVRLATAGDAAELSNGAITIRWLQARAQSADDEVDIYEITLENTLIMKVTLRPEVWNLRTPTDGVVHLDVEIVYLGVSNTVHGVLGQTYRPDHRDRLEKQQLVRNDHLGVDMVPGDNAEGFLDYTMTQYEASSLLATDCTVSRYALSAGSSTSSYGRRLMAMEGLHVIVSPDSNAN